MSTLNIERPPDVTPTDAHRADPGRRPPEGAPQRGRARELEGYRGLVGLTIVVFHVLQYAVQGGAHLPPLLAALARFETVDVLFLMSAYLLTLSYARAAIHQTEARSARQFLFRRAVRILPLYWVGVTTVWAIRNPALPGDWVDLVEHLLFLQVFYGPRVRTAHAGERLVSALLEGRRGSLVGSLDQPHSFTYVPDLARAMIRAAQTPSLWGEFLHAPTAQSPTQRELAEALAQAAGVTSPRLSVLPARVLKVAGLVSRDARELAETSYQFTGPFVLDSSRSEALLGQSPTPLDVGAKETVDWWRAQV